MKKKVATSLAVVSMAAVGVLVSGTAPASADTSPTDPFDLGVVTGPQTLNLTHSCSTPGTPVDVTLSFGPNQGMIAPAITPSTFTIDCSTPGVVIPYTVTFTPTTTPGTYVNSVQVAGVGVGPGTAYYWKFTVPSTPPACSPPNARNARTPMSAAQWNEQSGVATWGPCTGIGSLDGDDWLGYTGVNFGDVSPTSVTFKLATPNAGRKLYVRLDSRTGPVVATLTTAATGADWEHLSLTAQTAALTTPVTGVHRVYLTSDPLSTSPYNFGVANIESFQFL